jgi:hypothetical protein
VLLVQHTVSPGLGSRRQLWWQCLAGDRHPRCELFGIARAAARLGAGDPQPVGDHLMHRATDVGRILFDQAHDEVMAGHYLLASGSFEPLECVQPNPSTVVFEVHLTDLRHRCIKRIEGSGHLGRHGDTNRTHVRNASPRRPAATGAEAPTVDKGATVDNFDTL